MCLRVLPACLSVRHRCGWCLWRPEMRSNKPWEGTSVVWLCVPLSCGSGWLTLRGVDICPTPLPLSFTEHWGHPCHSQLVGNSFLHLKDYHMMVSNTFSGLLFAFTLRTRFLKTWKRMHFCIISHGLKVSLDITAGTVTIMCVLYSESVHWLFPQTLLIKGFKIYEKTEYASTFHCLFVCLLSFSLFRYRTWIHASRLWAPHMALHQINEATYR